MVHGNAPLTEAGRLRLARRVVDENWPLARAAERFQVAVGTVQQWAQRYRAEARPACSTGRAARCSARDKHRPAPERMVNRMRSRRGCGEPGGVRGQDP